MEDCHPGIFRVGQASGRIGLRRVGWALRLGLVLLAFFNALGSRLEAADLLRSSIKGFSVVVGDETTGFRKSMLRGDSMVPGEQEDLLEIDGVAMQVYSEGGETNLVLMSSYCFYNTKTEVIFSPSQLDVSAGDGSFMLRGEGFHYDVKDEQLVISNRVTAFVQKEMIAQGQSGSLGGGEDAGLLPAGDEATQKGPSLLRIQADRLDYIGETAVFRDNVRVTDREGRVTCDRLEVVLQVPLRKLEALAAAGHVVIDTPEVQSRAERAIYRPDQEILELIGRPEWEAQQGRGTADRLIVHRSRRSVRGEGTVRLRLKRSAVQPAAGWLGTDPPAQRDAAETTEEQFVFVSADTFEVSPDPSQTNLLVTRLEGQVVVEEDNRALECGRLTILATEPDYEARRILAEQDPVIREGEEQVTCVQAVYDGETGQVTMDGPAHWQTAKVDGRADQLWMDVTNRIYRATGQVRMQIKTDLSITPAFLQWGGNSASPTAPADPPVAETSVRPLDIWCEAFELRQSLDPDGVQSVICREQVLVRDGTEMELACEQLEVDVVGPTNQLQRLEASDQVEIRSFEEHEHRVTRGDHLIYLVDSRQVVLEADERVEFLVISPDGVSRGTGRRAVFSEDTRLLTVDGAPRVTTPQGDLEGDRMTINTEIGLISALGAWEVSLPLGALGFAPVVLPDK